MSEFPTLRKCALKRRPDCSPRGRIASMAFMSSDGHAASQLRLQDDVVEVLHDAGSEELHQAGLQEAVGVGHSAGHHHHAS